MLHVLLVNGLLYLTIFIITKVNSISVSYLTFLSLFSSKQVGNYS